MDDHVRRLIEHGPGVAGDRHAPGRVLSLDDVAQVAPGLVRIGIDRPDNLDGAFFAHQPHDTRADGAHAVLHRPNLFLQSQLRPAISAL